MKYRVTFYCLTVGLDIMFGKFMYLVQNVTIFHICGTCSGSSPPPPHSQPCRPALCSCIVIGACGLCKWRTVLWSSFQVDKCFRGNSNGLSQFRGIWQSLLEGFLPASMLLGSPGFHYCLVSLYRAHKKMVCSWERWWRHGPVAGTPGLSLLRGLFSTSHHQWALNKSMNLSPDFLTVITVSHFQWNITLFLELLHVFGSWLRWSLPVSRLSAFPLKLGQAFVFAEVCHYLLVTDVQPPLCWWPRKFWTAALCASRDWSKVFKVKSVFFFFSFLSFSQNRVYQKQDIFMLMRTLSTTKPSKAASLDQTSLRFENILETTWKKNGFSKGNNEVKPRYYFIILSFIQHR